MLRKTMTLLMVLIYFTIVKAQYDYTQFKYANVDVRGLSLNADLDLGEKRNNFAGLQNGSLFGLFSNGGVNYFRFVNMPEFQAQTNFLNNFTINAYQDEEDLSYGQNILSTFYSAIRTKFREDQRFKETVLSGNNYLNYNTFINRLNHDEDTKNFYLNPNVSFTYRVGKGRIEPIGPVFLARFMVEDLKENGLIDGTTIEDRFMAGKSQEWSQEELFELGRLIAEQQNRRVFDLRIRNKDQIRKVVEHITRLKQLDPLDVYAMVADNWQFAYQFDRSSGSRAYWGIKPGANVYLYNGAATYETSFGLERGWRKEMPVSYKRQKSLDASIGLGVSSFLNDINDYNQYYATASFNYEVGYYPSSRTYAGLAFSLDAQARYSDELDELVYDITPAILYRASHFINYNTRLDLQGRFYHRYYKYIDPRESGTLLISAGLTHNFY
ncbi:MAG: hypothetical protein IPN29_15855 [Saprospiraceae bacterium]|nr:hypothetical protein [Saprospiraceae bacterium]